MTYSNGISQALSIRIVNGSGAGAVDNPRCGRVTIGLKIATGGSVSVRLEGYDAMCKQTLHIHPGTVVGNQIKAGWQTATASRAELSLTRQ